MKLRLKIGKDRYLIWNKGLWFGEDTPNEDLWHKGFGFRCVRLLGIKFIIAEL